MSARKRKKRGKQGGDVESAAPLDAEGGEEAVDAAAESGEVEEANVEAEEEQAPAVSEISELKPRRKRRRKGEAEEAESAETSAADAEPSEAEAEVEEEEEEDEAFGDDAAKEAPKTRAQLKRVLESLIFVSDQVITAQQLGRIAKTKIGEVREALAEISVEYEGRGIELVEVNGGYQFRSAAASGPYVRALVAQRPVRLTRAQLETLALIAYRQPITRPEVDDVRGVDSGSAIKVLLDRELIKILGRKEDAGRPLLYGTTPFFLEFFGMNTMQELPTLREFTELSDEHQELFKRKTNEIGDLSAEADVPISVAEAGAYAETEVVSAERWEDEAGVEVERTEDATSLEESEVEERVDSAEDSDVVEAESEADAESGDADRDEDLESDSDESDSDESDEEDESDSDERDDEDESDDEGDSDEDGESDEDESDEDESDEGDSDEDDSDEDEGGEDDEDE